MSVSSSPRAAANRERLFQAALALIDRQGFEATKMEQIAREAGMARASAFNHFPSKLLFLDEFFRRFTHDVISAAGAAQLTGFRNRLEALFAAIGPVAHANKNLMREIASLAMGHGPLAPVESEVDDEMREFFLALVRDAQADGEVRADRDPVDLATLMLDLLTVTVHTWVNQGQTRSLQADLSHRFELLFQGIAEK